jgi:hypothetical protein
MLMIQQGMERRIDADDRRLCEDGFDIVEVIQIPSISLQFPGRTSEVLQSVRVAQRLPQPIGSLRYGYWISRMPFRGELLIEAQTPFCATGEERRNEISRQCEELLGPSLQL